MEKQVILFLSINEGLVDVYSLKAVLKLTPKLIKIS